MESLRRRWGQQEPRRIRRPIRIQVSIPVEISNRLMERQAREGIPVAEQAWKLMQAGIESLETESPERPDTCRGDGE